MEEVDSNVKCEKCGQSFTNVQARASHVKWIHESPLYRCQVCFKSCRDSYDLKRHMNSMHAKEKANGSFKSCPICDCKINKKGAAEHFQHHGFDMVTETLNFADGATFEQWKTTMETETNSRFVKLRGQRNGQQEYCCHRSGSFKSKGQGVRRLKSRGSNKIGAYCPASILTDSLPSGEVIVTFQKTHVGHEKEVERQWLTKEEKSEFASKIAMGMSLDDILDEVVTPFEGTLCRRDLTTRKDLHNIIQRYKLKNDGATDLEKRKAALIEKFTEMVLSIKSNAELRALERYIASLKALSSGTDDKASVNFPEVAAIMKRPAIKKVNPQRKFLKNETPVLKEWNLDNSSPSECEKILFSTVTVVSLSDYA